MADLKELTDWLNDPENQPYRDTLKEFVSPWMEKVYPSPDGPISELKMNISGFKPFDLERMDRLIRERAKHVDRYVEETLIPSTSNAPSTDENFVPLGVALGWLNRTMREAFYSESLK